MAYGLQTQRNMRIHLLAGALVISLSCILRVAPAELLMLVFAVSLVWVTEMLNTAIEKCVDLITEEYHPLAATAKNVAAGAVLVAAVNAVLAGLVVFGPRVLALGRQWLRK